MKKRLDSASQDILFSKAEELSIIHKSSTSHTTFGDPYIIDWKEDTECSDLRKYPVYEDRTH